MPAATLSAARDTQRQDGVVIRHLMTASKTIYKGALVAIAPAAGTAEPFTDAAGKQFAGIAEETATSAASGSTYVRVRRMGAFRLSWFDDDAVAQADVQDEVYGASDAQVSPNNAASGATNKVGQDIKVGRVIGFDGTAPIVAIDGYC